ncbi:MAG: ribosome small subunit-dependent GTPase A [Armatimonadota bacterium]
MNLETLGWDDAWDGLFEPYRREGYVPGRISLEHKNLLLAFTEVGEIPALVTGRMYFAADGREDLPAVGDWVALRLHDPSEPKATIHGILPRRSAFTRKEAGQRTGAQVVAANINTALLVMGLDGNYSLRRIERYLALAWESGAAPVVLLTKADLCADAEAQQREIAQLAAGVPVHPVSTLTGYGLEALDVYLQPGHTLALLGSSGVGKSTFLNHLLGGDVQPVQEVREDDCRGRHTTTRRQLFQLPGGALVIDTPGMRELQLWDAEGGLQEAFAEIDTLARDCRFHDCRHQDEPGCRVLAAIADGTLDPARLDSYRHLQRELHHLAIRQDTNAEQVERKKWKKIHKAARHFDKGKLWE